MSILIKGRDIPQGCFSTDGICFAYDGVECHCRLVPDKIIHFSTRVKNERPSWCPLVELPPHGRLIDADALIAKVREELLSPHCKKGALEIMGAMFRDVLDAPTIIESEGEDD